MGSRAREGHGGDGPVIVNCGSCSSSGEGRGSRVRVSLNEVRAVFHRPHPRKETDKGALKSVRRFLSEAGVVPEE